jgi:biopolymer transport protein TolR
MSSGPQNTDGEALSEVNVIPLADLSLVLLIILMVISPMIMQSMIKVASTRATAEHTSASPDKEPPLIVVLNADGSVVLNTVKMTDLDLAAALSQAFGNRKDHSVLMTVDPQAVHGRFVQILDIIKQQGAEKISLLRKTAAKA